MFKKNRPQSIKMEGDNHLYDEHAMAQIEKDMLENIHRHIRGRSHFLRSKTTYLLAASFMLIGAITFLFIKNGSNDNLITITANRGHISLITLPDGSKVWLNSGSTLSYPAAFASIRSVELVNGEAFFDIRHDAKHPFIVHYGNLHAQVLGTSFNIKYYKKLNNFRVTVVTGLVEVGDQKNSFGLISPNKEIIYNQKTAAHDARTINSQKVVAWKAREVNLYDVPFEDLILTIQNVYDIKVNYDDGMKDVITTIHFSSTDNLKDVLDVIKTIHRLNYKINGKEVELYNTD